MTVAGRFVHLRLLGEGIESLTLVGGRRFFGAGWTVETDEDAWRGEVEAVNPRDSTFTTTMRLPMDGRLNNAVIVFSNPGYSRTTAYRVRSIVRAGSRWPGSESTGRFCWVWERWSPSGKTDTFTCRIPHEYAFSGSPTGENSFFAGKRIFTASGAGTTIRTLKPGDPMALTVESTAGFKPGMRFDYADVAAGDGFEILSTCSLTRTAPNQYRIDGNASTRGTPPAGIEIVLQKQAE